MFYRPLSYSLHFYSNLFCLFCTTLRHTREVKLRTAISDKLWFINRRNFVTYYHAQFRLIYEGHAIKGLVVSWILLYLGAEVLRPDTNKFSATIEFVILVIFRVRYDRKNARIFCLFYAISNIILYAC